MPQHCYTLSDYSPTELRALLDRAEALRDTRTSDLLCGKSVVLLFLAPSLRTRVSMELAATQLGAQPIVITNAGVWKLEFREGVVMNADASEHASEAVRVLARYADVLGVRAFPDRRSWSEDAADPVLSAFLRYSQRPVINLESTRYHPCQALADLLTIERCVSRSPGKIVLQWANHPKALPVAVPNSFALAVTQRGWDLTIARPPGYDLPDDVMTTCRAFADSNQAQFCVTDDRAAACAGAAVVYAKSWGRLDRYGREDDELAERRAASLDRWIVDEHLMQMTDNAYFMHCLPVRRNVVVSDAVIDGPRSLVIEQAENRLHAQKAMLASLLA